jgi:hypothetical protein
MIRAVSNLKYATLAVIACLASCGNEQVTSSPPEDPSGVELEQDEEETTEEGTTGEVEGEDESAEDEPAEAEEPDAPEAPREKPPPRKACAELPESTCKVTVGCKWHSKDKCIDE